MKLFVLKHLYCSDWVSEGGFTVMPKIAHEIFISHHLNPKRETGEGSVTAEMFSFTFSDDYYI